MLEYACLGHSNTTTTLGYIYNPLTPEESLSIMEKTFSNWFHPKFPCHRKSQVFIIIFFFILIIKINWRIMNCFVHFFQIGKDLYYFVYSYSTLSLFRISYINCASCCTFFFQPATFNHIQQNRSWYCFFYFTIIVKGTNTELFLFSCSTLPHLSRIIPCSYWASTCIAALPSCMTLYEISVRQTRNLPVVSLFPHPASFRFHLTMDTLAFGYILPTTGCTKQKDHFSISTKMVSLTSYY